MSSPFEYPSFSLELVILIGLQGAGKSTFARERFGEHVLVSKDRFPNARHRATRQERQIRVALESERSTLVDGTNPTRVEREALIALGRQARARVVGYYLSARGSIRCAARSSSPRDARSRSTSSSPRARSTACSWPRGCRLHPHERGRAWDSRRSGP